MPPRNNNRDVQWWKAGGDDATANILTILAFLAVIACLIIKAVRK